MWVYMHIQYITAFGEYSFDPTYLPLCSLLLDLYAFPPFVDHLPPEKKDLRALLEKSVQVAVPNWFIVLCGKLMPDDNVCWATLFNFNIFFI